MSRAISTPSEARTAPRIAVVADWLVSTGGTAQVVREILATFPDADLFALFDVMAPAERAAFSARPARTTFMQHLPDIEGRYRSLLPLMPTAVRSFKLAGYDLVISSHQAVAKGFRARKEQRHLCSCHAPTRPLWDQRDTYLEDHGITGIRAAVEQRLLDRLRAWDRSTADGVDHFLARSPSVAERIRACYGRESEVLLPPVDTAFFTPAGDPQPDLYVAGGRHRPHKRLGRLIEAFRALPDRRLVILGDGPELARLRAEAASVPNVRVPGDITREEVRDWLRHARAFLSAADDDLALLPIEAQACGTPVIAYARTGASDAVVSTPEAECTGITFEHATPAGIAATVRRFEAMSQAPTTDACWTNASRFGIARFRDGLRAAAEGLLASSQPDVKDAADQPSS